MFQRKGSAALLLILFLALSLVPSVGMMIFGGSRAGANEILAPRPRLRERDGTLNTEFLTDCSDYLSDRFFLRQEAITLRNRLSTDLFATSPSPKVALGREDWLFYAETLEAAPRSDAELWRAGENLKLLQEYAQSRGSRFLFVLCPNKASLCPDAIRSGSPTGDGQRFEQLLDTLEVAHCSLYEVLQGREELFYHTDSHWNGKGAAAAADAILAELDMEGGFARGPFTEGAGHAGDLSEMLYPAAPAVETDYSYPFRFTYTSKYKAPNDPLITAEGSGKQTLYCYRDSFGNDLHPYLAESFAASTFSRKTAFDLTGETCDVLLIELVERNISYLSRYEHTYPAPERSIELSTVEGEPLTAKRSEAGALIRLSGELAGYDPAPLYLRVGGQLYECAPTESGFTLCLPELSGEAALIYQLDGVRYAAPLTIN